jgi:hypothetical protein
MSVTQLFTKNNWGKKFLDIFLSWQKKKLVVG